MFNSRQRAQQKAAEAAAAKAPPATAATAAGGHQRDYNYKLSNLEAADHKTAHEARCKRICDGLLKRFGCEVNATTLEGIMEQVVVWLREPRDCNRLVNTLFDVVSDASKKWDMLIQGWEPKSPNDKPKHNWVPVYVGVGNPLLTNCLDAFPLHGVIAAMFPGVKFPKGIVPQHVICPWHLTMTPEETCANCPLGCGKTAQILHLPAQDINPERNLALMALALVQASTWTERPIDPKKMLRWLVMAMQQNGFGRSDLTPEQKEFLAELDPVQQAILLREQAAAAAEAAAAKDAELAALKAEMKALKDESVRKARACADLENQSKAAIAAQRRAEAKVDEVAVMAAADGYNTGFHHALVQINTAPTVCYCPICHVHGYRPCTCTH
jgi:hypothetical protein